MQHRRRPRLRRQHESPVDRCDQQQERVGPRAAGVHHESAGTHGRRLRARRREPAQALRSRCAGDRAASLPGGMRLNMRPSMTSRHQQTGAYLLEALIGILIFALGVLGIVGLQAASLRTTTDSGLRAEAIFAANQLLGQMWTDDGASLTANYSSAVAGQPYKDFAAQL